MIRKGTDSEEKAQLTYPWVRGTKRIESEDKAPSGQL